MNYDLDTKDGMANAIKWTNNMMSTIKNGGAWIVPRSGTLVRMVSHADKHVKLVHGLVPDPAILRVLQAGGWKVEQVQEN